MRRSLPTVLAALLVLSAAPALAADEEASAAPTPAAPQATLDPDATAAIEAPNVGLTLSFPAEWRLSLPEGERVSEITGPDGEPIMATTAIYAMGQGGQWCNVDVYFDAPASLQEHTFALASYLQQKLGKVPMVVTETDIPVGHAFRIEVLDTVTARIRTHYLFERANDDGTNDRFVLTCANPVDVEALGQAIAETAVFTDMVAAEEPSAAPSEAPAE